MPTSTAALIPLLLIANHDMPPSVTDIYTIHRYPPVIKTPDIRSHCLDTVTQLENQFFPLLSSYPEVAKQQAWPLLSSPQYLQQRQQLETAYQDLIDAWSLGVTKIPAVVFDRRYVVYGTTDPELARQQLAAFQEKQQ